MKRYDRREFLRLGLYSSVAVGWLLAGCGPLPTGGSAHTGAARGGLLDISFWHGNSGPLGKILQTLTDRFNASQDKYRIKAEFVGDYTTLNQKIMAAVAAGSPPVAAQAGAYGAVAQYLKDGLIVPVGKFVDGSDGLSPDSVKDIFPGFIEDNTFTVDGKPTLVSWPFNKSVLVLYYNGTMLQEAGVDVPASWDDFVSASQRLMQAGKVPAGIGWTPASDWFAALLLQNGGTLLSPDGRQAAFASDAGVRALTFLQELYQRKIMYLTKSFDWQNDLVQRKIAFAVSTIVSQQYIQQDLKGAFDLGVAPLPAGERKATVLFGSNGVIFAKASPEAQAGAWAFFKWWAEPEQTAWWSVNSHYLPLRRSALDTQLLKGLFAKDPRQKVALESLDWAHPMPDNVAAWVRVDPVLTDAITKAVTGLASPRDALSAAAEQADAILQAS
ncbi:MAG: ABC transporter substrate-binding protein [Bacillota bacterium]|nr:ABC transporter substrate-binding protein [Bacillota bacterium]